MEYSKRLKFGYGVFETIKYDDDGVYVDEHMKRLNQSLISLNMKAVDIELVKKEALSKLQSSDDDAIRISVYEGSPQYITYETRKADNKPEYKVIYSDIRRHSSNTLLQIKSSCHLSYVIEKTTIKNKGYDEAIHFNEEGHLTEGVYTNLFFVKDEVVYTPDVSCGLLPGIYREKVIESIKKLGIPIKIGYYNKEDLVSADEVFLTNSLIGIMPVFELEDKHYNKENQVTQLLIKEML
jgi:4-amino-4-deoxychorismate lyase